MWEWKISWNQQRYLSCKISQITSLDSFLSIVHFGKRVHKSTDSELICLTALDLSDRNEFESSVDLTTVTVVHNWVVTELFPGYQAFLMRLYGHEVY